MDGSQKWYHAFISPAEIQSVESAVTVAEKSTSGEIVPMIVRRSTQIGHVPFTLLLFGYLLVSAVYICFGATHSWQYIVYAVVALVFWPLSLWLSNFKIIQRLFTTVQDREIEVLERAEIEFYRHRMEHTQARTGVLIFVSLMEQRCVVLADQGISKLLPRETWQHIVDEMVLAIRGHQAGSGLVKAVEQCGRLLAQHFPSRSHNPNELVNKLVIKE